MGINDISEVAEATIKRGDIFKTVLGLLFLFTAGYLWVKYFLNINGNLMLFFSNHLTYYILLWLIIILALIGVWYFVVGFSEIESIFDIDRTIIQINYIKSLENIKELDLSKFAIDKKTKTKFLKYIKEKIKESIKYFE